MKDERTEEQKYSAWVNAVIVAHQAGWKQQKDGTSSPLKELFEIYQQQILTF